MGDYSSYRSTRVRSYDDDDLMSSKTRNLHRLACDTLDDNDEIARRSKRHDQKLLSEITNKLNIYDAPLPHPRHVNSKKVVTNHARRSHHPSTVTPTASVLSKSALPKYLDASKSRYSDVLSSDYETNRRVEALIDYDLPNAMRSLSSVRDHVNDVKGGMGAHRMLIDRYLTLDLGPSQDVDYAVARKYHELASRMPGLEPDKYHMTALYSDEPGVNLSKAGRSRSAGNISHYGHFNQPVSSVRNKLRKVITKSRGNPTFYSY